MSVHVDISSSGPSWDELTEALIEGTENGLERAGIACAGQARENLLDAPGQIRKWWDTGRLATSIHVKTHRGAREASVPAGGQMDDVEVGRLEVAVGSGLSYAWFVENGFHITPKTMAYFAWRRNQARKNKAGKRELDKWTKLFNWAMTNMGTWISGAEYLYRAGIWVENDLERYIEDGINYEMERAR